MYGEIWKRAQAVLSHALLPLYAQGMLLASGTNAVNNVVYDSVDGRITDRNLWKVGWFHLLFANENPYFEFK